MRVVATCGGHGYLANAGFGTTFASYAQTSRMKATTTFCVCKLRAICSKPLRALQAKLVTEVKLVGQMRYWEKRNTFTSTLGHEVDIRDEDGLLRAYEHRAWRLCSQATAVPGIFPSTKLCVWTWLAGLKSPNRTALSVSQTFRRHP